MKSEKLYLTKFFLKIAESKIFSSFIILVIVGAGAIVGLQTYKWESLEMIHLLHVLDMIVLWIFVFEIIVKMGSEGNKPWRYFRDPWNIFDFFIVVVCFLPLPGTEFAAVLRLARILRVFKLVTALPKLQLIVGALLKSIPSMGYVFILLLLQFYIYAALGTFLYCDNDPIHFGKLHVSMLSLFRAVTLEGWSELMYINMYGSDFYGYDSAMDLRLQMEGITRVSNSSPLGAAVFFVSFILVGAMMVLNLFIGVIMNGMDEMKAEAELEEKARERAKNNVTIHDEISIIEKDLGDLTAHLQLLNKRIKLLEKEKKA